jgi:hypothetical protein
VKLTARQVHEMIGEVDDLLVARILATGATEQELAEAVGETELEDEQGEAGPAPPSPRVARLRAILGELLSEDERAGEAFR